MDKKLVLKDLDEILNFIVPNLNIANLNNSDFIIDNHWNLLEPEIARELLLLNENDIAELPSGSISYEPNVNVESNQYGPRTPLKSFVYGCYSNTLPHLNSLSNSALLTRDLNVVFPCPPKPSISSFMSPKKQYEVELLAALCNEICLANQINKVVDIGSGLGYLGGYLSLMFGYDVLAIDSVKDRTETAEKRTKLLKKQWISLIQNALNDKTSGSLSSIELDQYKKNFTNSSFTPLCLYITSGAQLDKLCTERFGSEQNFMFTGLHACGDLSPSVIKLFVSCPSASVLCLVGCCYNLLTEHFLIENTNSDNFGFPISNHLKEKSFSLGINARSLASQSPDRLCLQKKTPPESLFWRALLQVILVDKLGRPKLKNQWRVGKVASKSKSFHDYVLLSLKKLGLDIHISEEEALDYLKNYEEFRRKCLIFYQLRICLGPCIESLVQLDRLLFLLEQDSIKSAHLVQLFDPVQSPRCYALIATKNET